MNEPNAPFRSTFFGGFNREDVVNYIQKSDNEHFAAEEELKKQSAQSQTVIAELREENEMLTQKNAEILERLGEMTLELEKARTEFAEADKKLSLRETEIETQNAYAQALLEKNNLLAEENEVLLEKCKEYDIAKEKIAEIELSAYYRAKQIEQEAKTEIEKLREQSAETLDKVKNQLSEIKEKYRMILARSKEDTEQVTKKANDVIGEIDRISGDFAENSAEESKNFRQKLNNLFSKAGE